METRRRTQRRQDLDEDDGLVPMPILRPAVRSIPRSTIKQHWRPMGKSGHKHIKKLLEDTLTSVLTHVRSENKKKAVQEELNSLIRHINGQLTGIMVPRYTREGNFSYEKLSSQNRAMEMTLVPELEQIGVLELELRREQTRLEEDTASLHHFQDKKRALDARNKALQKQKLHPLLKSEVEDPVEIDDHLIRQSNSKKTNEERLFYDLAKDRPLKTTVRSLSNSLEHINANTKPLEDLMCKVRSAEQRLLDLAADCGMEGQMMQRWMGSK
ncbi:uncharacterized protein VTP21DRAFT_9421 [Calcarisporiella thermophila]|uniref:uncharacterized protein n=1 Tax=Calcarisporiella thermophila TaxID=911321 RepID=UPI003742959B